MQLKSPADFDRELDAFRAQRGRDAFWDEIVRIVQRDALECAEEVVASASRLRVDSYQFGAVVEKAIRKLAPPPPPMTDAEIAAASEANRKPSEAAASAFPTTPDRSGDAATGNPAGADAVASGGFGPLFEEERLP